MKTERKEMVCFNNPLTMRSCYWSDFIWNGQKKMQSDEGYLVKYSLPNKKLEVIVHGI